jgi:hypothetical protein
MSEAIKRFSLEAAKFNGQVFFFLLLVWVVILFCAIVSIKSQGFSESQQRMWIWFVVGVPLLGVLVYLPFSVRREDLPQILLLIMQKDRLSKRMKKAATSKGARHA